MSLWAVRSITVSHLSNFQGLENHQESGESSQMFDPPPLLNWQQKQDDPLTGSRNRTTRKVRRRAKSRRRTGCESGSRRVTKCGGPASDAKDSLSAAAEEKLANTIDSLSRRCIIH